MSFTSSSRTSKAFSAALLASAIMAGSFLADKASAAVGDYVVSSNTTQDGGVYLSGTSIFRLTDGAILTGTNGAFITSGSHTDGYAFVLEAGQITNVNLSGETSLFKTGSDTVVLDSVNDLTGNVVIEAGGTLALALDNAVSSSRATFVRGALEIGSTDQETGSVIIAGGHVTGRWGVLRSRDGFFVSGGSTEVEFADADFGTPASFVKSGEGTFTFLVSSSYTGDTVVEEGTLDLTQAYYALSEYSSVILGDSATIDIRGTGQVFGSLSTEGTDSWSYATVLANDASLYVGANNTDATFAGTIRGENGDWSVEGEGQPNSNIFKVGTGSWTMSGGIYGIDTLVGLEGGLFVDGWVHVAAAANGSGSILGGTGYIGADYILNAGVLMPGSVETPGAFTFFVSDGGFFQMEDSSNLVIRLQSKDVYGSLNIYGDVEVGGYLTIAPGKGYRPSLDHKFTILSIMGEISGDFAGVNFTGRKTMLRPVYTVQQTTDFADIAPYDNNYDEAEEVLTQLILSFEQGEFGGLPGLTPNQRAVGEGVDSSLRRGNRRLANSLNAVDYDKIPDVLTLLSPEQLGVIYQLGFNNARIQNRNIERRLDDARRGVTGFSANGLALSGGSENREGLTLAGFDGKSLVGKNTVAPVVEESRWTFFATGNGEWADIETTRDARGSEFTTGGVTVGADYRVSNNLVVGLAGSYVHTGSDLWDGGRVKLDGGKGSLYATLFNDNAYVNAAVGGGYNSYDTRRSTLGGIARGTTNGGEFNSLLSGGYLFKGDCGFSIGPVASLQYTYIGLNSFRESGSDAPLHYPSQHQDSLRSAIGVRAAYDWSVGGVVITPEVRAQWAHEYLDSTAAIVSQFAAAGSTFRVNGPKIGRDSLVVDAGATVQINPNWAVFAYYNSELFRTNFTTNSVSGGFRVSF